MLVKALTSFAGKVSMYEGEVQEIADNYVTEDLLKAGYIEKIEKPQVEQKKVVAKKATKKH